LVFSSLTFIFFFLPLALAAYYSFPRSYRNAVLLFFSLLFYASGEVKYLWLIGLSILFNFTAALLLEKYRKAAKSLLIFSVVVNLATLIYFKYAGFIVEHLNLSFDHFKNIILPLGISFYTFHSISYLVDIYRGKSAPQRNVFTMGLYIVNFSQLVAGPIIRYHDVAKQLNRRLHHINRFQNGIKLFILGLAKKMLIANTVGEFADVCFNESFGPINGYFAWMGALAYALQIYFDFSGYSDMAIGIGRMFGFEFKQNFKLPYGATSIREFWQKWHISLSSWFRDYVYIPLGGNRMGNFRTSFNLLSIFILCGFWHGANFTFLIWGLFHGLFLIMERVVKVSIPNHFLKRTLAHSYVWIVLLFSWVFFRAEDVDSAFRYQKTMLFFSQSQTISPDLASFFSPYLIFVLLLGTLISVGVFSKNIKKIVRLRLLPMQQYRWMETIFLLILFCLSVLQIMTSAFNPFIYYRF
jgi:alginate O-acetyltransferase complex protein AlgI